MPNNAPDFSPFAAAYAAARPTYPPDLFEWLASVAPAHDVAWDVATGNGQAAAGLAVHFHRVIATDISPEQLANAAAHRRVEYREPQPLNVRQDASQFKILYAVGRSA